MQLVPNTGEGIRAAVSALRFFDGSKGESFHVFSLPVDRCVRLLVKKLDRHMSEDVVREEMGDLGIPVQGDLQLRSGCRAQEADKTRPLNLNFIVSVAREPEVTNLCSLTELCGLRASVEKYSAPKDPSSANTVNASATQRYCGYAPRRVACGVAHL